MDGLGRGNVEVLPSHPDAPVHRRARARADGREGLGAVRVQAQHQSGRPFVQPDLAAWVGNHVDGRDVNRLSGTRALGSVRPVTASGASGLLPRSERSGLTVSVNRFAITAWAVGPVNARSPLNIS